MHKGAAKGEFLFHTTGQCARLSVVEGFELAVYILDIVVVRLHIRPEDSRIELKVFFNAQVLVEGEMARHITDFRTDFPIVLHDVEAADTCGSTVCKGKSREDAEKRRLPRTVGSDETENLAGADFEGYVLEGRNLFIGFTEPFRFNHCFHCYFLTYAYIPKRIEPSFGTETFTA